MAYMFNVKMAEIGNKINVKHHNRHQVETAQKL